MSVLRILIPIALGLTAGVINFLVLRGSTAPVALTVMTKEVRQGSEITEELLEKIEVRADRKVFRSAVPWGERGILLRRRSTRSIGAGEVILYSDVRPELDLVTQNFQAGDERSETFSVRHSRLPPGLKAGDNILIFIAGGEVGTLAQPAPAFNNTFTTVGPVRVVGMTERSEPFGGIGMSTDNEVRRIAVAIPRDNPQRIAAPMLSLRTGNDRGEKLLGVEYAK